MSGESVTSAPEQESSLSSLNASRLDTSTVIEIEENKIDEIEDIEGLISELQSDESDNVHETENYSEDNDGTGIGQIVPEELLKTDPTLGLTDKEASRRIKRFGKNELKSENKNFVLTFFMFFVGPIQFVMEAAAILAAALTQWFDFGIICALLVLNAVVGFVQEFQAGNTVEALKKTLANNAVVIRNGELVPIEAINVVPGDILELEEGTVIPADGRIISDNCELQVDQSAITGESLAAKIVTGEGVRSSSTVKRGNCFIVVTATGDATEVGRAATLVRKAESGPGHFTEVLNGIGIVLLSLVIFTLVVVWISGFYRNTKIVTLLGFTLIITVIGVPVGLPAVVTTTMAVGAAYLSAKKAIVQRLSAIESLAGVEILCSDKTGTLTRNKLSLHTPFTVEGVHPDELMLTACLAATRKMRGLDAIDKVFLKSLKDYPIAKAALCTYKILEFRPFDPVSKMVIADVESPEGEISTCVKGAPLFVLEKALQEDETIEDDVIISYKEAASEFAARGFRSLGVAKKGSDKRWKILGIMPCMDPPRHDTAKTIREAQHLGLSIKMLTGDAVDIARETSRQLGMGTNIYNSERLGLGGSNGDMSGSEVYDFVEAADGFAEVFPEHKFNVVQMLQERNKLVAMTGDGVNDAPSLKKADTGIAVEGATDAARSAADIVFTAPGLSTIIDAIKTSRQIFHRMYSYVVYRIALSIHLEIFFGLWIAILNETITSKLAVFLAIFADIATLTIAYDNAPYSQTPVKWNLPTLWGISIVLGAILAAGSWITLSTMLVNGGGHGIVQNYGTINGVIFLQIALSQNWLIFITRANGPFWSSYPSWQLGLAVFIVSIAASLITGFGLFCGGPTNIITIINVWIISFGVFCVMSGVYYLLKGSETFDNIMHGRTNSRVKDTRNLEDFMVSLNRVSTQHERRNNTLRL